MTEQQILAIRDAYTTLRAMNHVYGRTDLVTAQYCSESERLLVEAFPDIAALENSIDVIR